MERRRIFELTEGSFEPSLIINILLGLSRIHQVILIFGRSLNFSCDLFPFPDVFRRVIWCRINDKANIVVEAVHEIIEDHPLHNLDELYVSDRESVLLLKAWDFAQVNLV